MRALAVSGGGCKGAFAGGILEYLNEEYDILVGTSTGSLIIPLIAANEISKLKYSYTNTNSDDIFKVNPFKITTDITGETKVDMNIKNILYNLIIRRKKAFGDSSALRKKINEFLTKNDYDTIRESKIDVLVCVTNSILGVPEYKSIREYSLEDFKDWMWASTSAYPFMDTVKKEGSEYIDGGFTDPCPIQEAINRGATEIDAIILRTESGAIEAETIRNPIHGLGRIIDIMLKEINNNDVQIGTLNAKNKDVKLNIYYTPRVLTSNSLVFEKEKMEEWWEEGYNHAKNSKKVSYVIKSPNCENERIC